MSDVITCPSGLSGRIRGLKVREERILADRKLAKAGAQLDELLTSCWLETLDPGPYEEPLDWSKVLQGDRFFVLLMVRALSYGPEYAFSVTCESRGCRGRIHWELDLTQLPVRPLSDESRARFLAGNVFETTLPGALARATFHLATGADERRMAQSRKAAGDRPLTTLLAARLDAIDGVDTMNFDDAKKFCAQLGWRLPTKSELESLYKASSSPSLTRYSGMNDGSYWSSTLDSGSMGSMGFVYVTYFGRRDDFLPSSREMTHLTLSVRCVR